MKTPKQHQHEWKDNVCVICRQKRCVAINVKDGLRCNRTVIDPSQYSEGANPNLCGIHTWRKQ